MCHLFSGKTSTSEIAFFISSPSKTKGKLLCSVRKEYGDSEYLQDRSTVGVVGAMTCPRLCKLKDWITADKHFRMNSSASSWGWEVSLRLWNHRKDHRVLGGVGGPDRPAMRRLQVKPGDLGIVTLNEHETSSHWKGHKIKSSSKEKVWKHMEDNKERCPCGLGQSLHFT